MKKSNTAKTHPDRKLIKTCVEIGFVMGGVAPGFKIDPTGDSDFAAPLDCEGCNRVEGLVAKVTKIPATTLDGLAAKSGAAKLILAEIDNYAHDFQVAFLQSLADDALRFHKMAGGREFRCDTGKTFPMATATEVQS